MGQVESTGASHLASNGRSSPHSQGRSPPRGPDSTASKSSTKRASVVNRKPTASKKSPSHTAWKASAARDGRSRAFSRTIIDTARHHAGSHALNHHTPNRRSIAHNANSRKGRKHISESASRHPQPVIRRQRRNSAGTSSSIGTDGSVPVITITDHSDDETDIDFDPTQLQHKAGQVNRTSTPKVKREDMDLSLSRHESSSVGGKSASKKKSISPSKAEKAKSKEEKRSRKKSANSSSVSVASTSSGQSKSSKKVSKASRKSSAEVRRKRGLFSKADPKSEAANKWQDIVDEFETSLEDQASEKPTKTKKEQQRVNKLGNLEQYENVRQVFNKSMPLPMQMAPPGARVEDIEGETASETSSYSWNLMTPMQRASAASQSHQSSAQSQSQMRTSSMQSGRLASTGQMQTQSGSAAAMQSSRASGGRSASTSQSASRAQNGSASAAGAMMASAKNQVAKRQSTSRGGMSSAGAKRSVTAEHSVTEERREVVQSRAAAAAAKYGRREKGVKFRQSEVDLKASVIVDDAVQRALRFLYGQRRKSRAGSSSSNSRLNSSSQHQSSQVASSIMKSSHIERNIVEHIEHRRSSAKKIADKKASSSSLRPIPLSGQQGKERSHSMRPLPLSGKTNSEDLSGLYDLVIQPHGKDEENTPMDKTRRFDYPTPRSDTNSNTTTNIHVYHNENLPPPFPAYVPKADNRSDIRKGMVDPPTITRGTITRVFHELENQNTIPASSLLAQLRSMDTPPVEYSTNTWPLSKPVISLNDTAGTSFTDTSLPSYTINYNTLPSQGNLASYTGQWHSQHSLQDYPSGESTPSPTRIDLRMNTGQLVRSLPLSLPPSYVNMTPQMYPRQEIDDISQTLSLPVITEDDEYRAYSNEPIIVADLLDREEPIYTAKGRQPAVHMNKNQVLNFYLFNQQKPEPGMPKITYAAQEIETNFGGEQQQLVNVYLNEDEAKDMISEGVQVYQPEEPVVPDHREYTIYHKQTQTPDIPKPKKSPSTPKRIERQKERIIKHILPKKAPERPVSPVVHRETHHYITKERHVEKLPPIPPATSENCMQTEMSGRDWDDEVDAMNRALTGAERRALEAEQAVNEMHASNAAIDSVVREMEEVVRDQESQPPSPTREIPITMRPSPERAILDIVERKYEPQVIVPVKKEESEPEESDEEETYEWTEIEEKEQRLSMAIFEEIEFNLTRSQGGQTSTQTGKASELVPWLFPDKYEAIVDRRRQKVTQVKDIHKEGGHVKVQSGATPAALESGSTYGTLLETDLLSGEGKRSGPDILEERGVQSWSEHSKSTGGDGGQGVHKSELITTINDSSFDSSPTSGRYRTVYERQVSSPTPKQDASDTGKKGSKQTESYITVTRDNGPVSHKEHSSARMTEVGGHNQATGRDTGGSGMSSKKTITTYTRLKSPPTGDQHSTTYIRGPGSKDKVTKSEIHTTTYTRPVKDEHIITSTNSSGYSSSDNTSQLRIDKLHSFEMPGIDSAVRDKKHFKTETDIRLSRPVASQDYSTRTSEKSKRFVSRFDPGNIYFTVPQWTPVESSELLFNMSKDSDEADGKRDHDNDSLPDTLPGVEAEHIKRRSVATKSEGQQLPPKVHSEIVLDEEGNRMKVTTTEQKMIKTVDYIPEAGGSAKQKQTTEEMGEESFVEVDLTTEHFESTEVDNDDDNDNGNVGDSERKKPIQLPEVVSETSIVYKHIEYDDQEKSMRVPDEADNRAGLERQYLYDMNTATLRPVKIKDTKSGEMLMQYSIGDTMVTEL